MKKKDKTNWPAQQPHSKKKPVLYVYEDAAILDPNLTKKERQALAAIIEGWEK